ncbi:hypothetical protein BU16DRAFT_330767 [Lophium mytilinum]|uniref:Heterokaryon incompatibility domain-containing protein n=1 Tax=Lophium mytilinum TaxID=390894 RepID=A0A6A6R0T4_9PEZI|nr:hypothetical protein BU16DRAFT_330767 [Lophium mytilinum]
MRDVYRKAYLTICATSAACSADGFLLPRVFEWVELQWTWPLEEPALRTGVFYLARYKSSTPRDLINQKIEESVWNSRTWTFQERLLSRRMLHFTSAQIYFECASKFESEDEVLLEKARLNRKSVFCNQIGLGATHIDLYKRWYTLVSHYSARSLTYPSDKLPVLSGIALEMFQLLNDCYLAGLWRNDLIRGLLWELDERIPTPQTYRGPSWSWCSVKSGIAWPYVHDISEHIIKIMHTSTTPVGLGPFGAVSDGEILLSGKTVAVSVTKHQHEGRQIDSHSRLPYRVLSRLEWHLVHRNMDIGVASPSTDYNLAENRAPYFALWVLSGYPGARILHRGLILERTEDSQQHYRRIGTFFLHSNNSWMFSGVVDGTITLI